MNRIAEFHKVSFAQFKKDFLELYPNTNEDAVLHYYNDIVLPHRATKGSAGYDFFLPKKLVIPVGKTEIIPTGIRAKIEEGWFLMCCPRSGLGFKFRMRLDNTVGIIDSDYFNAVNEGHIMIKITNEGLENKTIDIEKGTAFAQGIFIPFGIITEDTAENQRTGGFGSTSY